MRYKHLEFYVFDAGRTGLFPSLCLLLGKAPGYRAAQGFSPTLALGSGSARHHYSVPSSTRDRAGEAHPQKSKGPGRKNRAIESNRPRVYWFCQSVIAGDGRRFITLRRSPGFNRGQSRAAHR